MTAPSHSASSTRASAARRGDDRTMPIAASLDALSIVLFVGIGRRNHDETAAMGDTIGTAAPFLIALLIAWILVRAWRNPTGIVTGLLLWPIVVVVAMLLRNLVFDDGTATSFIVVASIFLGLCLIGWRAVWTVFARRRATAG